MELNMFLHHMQDIRLGTHSLSYSSNPQMKQSSPDTMYTSNFLFQMHTYLRDIHYTADHLQKSIPLDKEHMLKLMLNRPENLFLVNTSYTMTDQLYPGTVLRNMTYILIDRRLKIVL